MSLVGMSPHLPAHLGVCRRPGALAARGGSGDVARAPQALQRHYHPDVSQAASVINQALSVPEVSITPLLELTAFEVRQGR